MNTLFVITHEDPSYVGICLGGVVMDHKFEKQKLVAEQMAEVSEALLKFHKKTIDDIEAVAVIIGPGSYTGIRVGMAFAKSLVQFSDRKLFAVGPFEVLENMWLINKETQDTPYPLYSSRLTTESELRGSSNNLSEISVDSKTQRLPLVTTVSREEGVGGVRLTEEINNPISLIDAGRGNVYIENDGAVTVEKFVELPKSDSQVFIGSGAVANGVKVDDNLKNISVEDFAKYIEMHAQTLKNYNSDFDTFVKLIPNYVQEARIG